MAVLFDYFSAGSDDDAAAVIDRPGGPGSPAVVAAPVPAKRRLFGRRSTPPSPTTDAAPVVHDTVSVTGIDPLVQMGTLEELLTGRPYDDVVEDPRAGHTVASADGGERLVCTLTDALSTALAEAGDDDLRRVAGPWSETEEFWGEADPEELAGFLQELAGLARRARTAGLRLYCWVCVQPSPDQHVSPRLRASPRRRTTARPRC